MVNADLLKIRALNGSQHFGFEELCCQLVSLELRPPEALFFRKGLGADAGVECFLRQADGSETGWQAKFFDDFGSGQASQLTESFKHAIEKHPRLTRYIVCLPIDLKDARIGKKKTEGQRWDDWRTARIADAKAFARTIEIELWQATNLRERLYRNDSNYAGRMQFFFDETHFTPDWFRHKFTTTCEALGARYTPQFNVSLPIRQAFLGISRDGRLDQHREGWVAKLRRQFKPLQSTLQQADIAPIHREPVFDYGRQLIEALEQSYSTAEPYPLGAWQSLINAVKEHSRGCLEHCWTRDEQGNDESKQNAHRYALNKLFELEQNLDDIDEALNSDTWRLTNEQSVLVYGEAGVGKSHLLADIAADTLGKGCPALLLINSQFFLQDPRTQILERLDLRDAAFSTLLGALDAAGQAAGIRALLMIDALNERHGIELWREHLAPLLSEIKRFPHLALIVSCRTTYLNILLPPDSPLTGSLPRLEHQGFADGDGRAARAYLAQRKIMRPSAPNLLPEFNNPLFLKTCCDSLDRQGLNTFPRGVQGLTRQFDFYLCALTEKIETRMNLDRRQKIVEHALHELTRRLLDACSAYLPLDQVITCFETVLPSMGQQDRSLLSELEHEGVLTVEPVYVAADKIEEQVRFTFERFSDFQIAEHLLQQHTQSGRTLQPLEASTPLHDFLAREDIYRFAGIVEALAVLLPERTDVELPDLSLPDASSFNGVVEEAFLKSLLLRRQDRFTAKTRELVIKFSAHHEDRWLTTLIAISTEPENPFNAHHLHDKLASLTMPERDARWSVAIASLESENGSPLEVLITWALESGFDEIDLIRAELAAIVLTWLFSVSHRTVRDRSTKALSALLAPRLPMACSLIERFQHIDDLYVLERLLAASYGAVLQAKTQEGLATLAMTVYEWLFASGRPPTHLLLRDYARGIVEYAHYRGVLPTGVAMEQVRPPYESDWPIDYVAEEDLSGYTDTRNGNTFKDNIVHSASSEWTGDFAKYIINPAVGHWSATTLDADCAHTRLQKFTFFRDLIYHNGTAEQVNAFTELVAFCRVSREQDSSQDDGAESSDMDVTTPVKVRFVSPGGEYWQRRKQNDKEFGLLEQALLGHLDNNARYAYQIGARHYLLGLMNGDISDRPEVFDVFLAQRWVTKRAHEVGWSSDLFGDFDQRVGTGRGRPNKHVERIGKKYQWLALYELLARMADNLIYLSRYADDNDAYDGPWQLGERNIDPSLLIEKTQDDGWEKHPAVWWSPQALKLRHLNSEEQLLWIENDKDQLNSTSLIDVTDPERKQRWLVLGGFKHYGTSYDAGPHVDSWCRIWCVVVRKSGRNRFVNAVARHTLIDPHALPEAGNPHHAFVGEYPWHPACAMGDDWTKIDRDYGYRYKILPTVGRYEAESGGYDRSLDGHVRIYLPAPWLVEKLGLRLIDGLKLHYADHAGRTLFKDPSIYETGPSTALVDRTAFLELMQRDSLAPVWVIAGEKGAYGEQQHDFLGRRVHSFVYVLNANNEIVCDRQNVRQER